MLRNYGILLFKTSLDLPPMVEDYDQNNWLCFSLFFQLVLKNVQLIRELNDASSYVKSKWLIIPVVKIKSFLWNAYKLYIYIYYIYSIEHRSLTFDTQRRNFSSYRCFLRFLFNTHSLSLFLSLPFALYSLSLSLSLCYWRCEVVVDTMLSEQHVLFEKKKKTPEKKFLWQNVPCFVWYTLQWPNISSNIYKY